MKAYINIIFERFGLIEQQNHHLIIGSLIISLLILPFGFMTIKSLFGVLFAICLLLSLAALFIKPKSVNHFFKEKNSYLIFLYLVSTPICIFLSQIIRGDFSARAYDGPIRLTIAFLILLAIYKHRIDFSRVSSLSIPLTLLGILIYAMIVSNPYGGRLTNDYLDPIIWGNFSVILGFMSLASIQSNDHLHLKAYKLCGFALGLIMSLLSQSRSGWVAAIIMAITWLALNRKQFTSKKIAGCLFTLIVTLLLLYFFYDVFKLRIDTAISEILDWGQNSKADSSAGMRLNMLKIASQIFLLSPFVGFGEFSKLPLENNIYALTIADPGAMYTLYCCGPHNDFAANALKFGIFGIFAFFTSLFIPMYILLKYKHHQSLKMGMMLITGIVVCGFFSEMLTLKVSYTFYAIFISGLMATALWKKDNLHEQK